MVSIKKAEQNVSVVFDDATGEPRIIIVDAHNLDDPSFNPEGHTRIEISPDIYNDGLKKADVHLDAITHAKEEFDRIKGRG